MKIDDKIKWLEQVWDKISEICKEGLKLTGMVEHNTKIHAEESKRNARIIKACMNVFSAEDMELEEEE